MTDIAQTPLGKLQAKELLLTPVHAGPTRKPGRVGFRGELALKLAATVAGEKRPPEVKADQVLFTASGEKLDFFACHVASLAHLALIADTLGDYLAPGGKYFVWAGNVDLLKKYSITLNDIPFAVYPLDEGTVYNELLDLFYLEKSDLKKLDTAGKLDAIADAAAKFTAKLPTPSFADAVQEMGPVKVVENRPV